MIFFQFVRHPIQLLKILNELIQQPFPASGIRQHVDEFLRYIEAGQPCVAADGVMSSVSRALIRSPLTDRSARRRICAGSARLFRYMTKVLSFENRLMASGWCEVMISCPLKCWRYFRSSMIKCPISDSARCLSGSFQKQKTGFPTALATIRMAAKNTSHRLKRH